MINNDKENATEDVCGEYVSSEGSCYEKGSVCSGGSYDSGAGEGSGLADGYGGDEGDGRGNGLGSLLGCDLDGTDLGMITPFCPYA